MHSNHARLHDVGLDRSAGMGGAMPGHKMMIGSSRRVAGRSQSLFAGAWAQRGRPKSDALES